MSLFFNDERNLVNLSNSILSYYGITPFHKTLKEVDQILKEKKKKKICLILLDGFGKSIQEKYKDQCPYIKSKPFLEITSVFPPTTVAATTALVSGKYPCETGWLGWTEKFDRYPAPSIMFYQQLEDEKQTKMDVSSYDLCPYEDIFSMLKKKGVKSEALRSFLYPEISVEEYFEMADKKLKENDFLYVYHTNPDSILHEFGVGSKEAGEAISRFDSAIQKLIRKNEDTLFFLLADHGHKNAIYYPIEEHTDFFSCLKYPFFSLEGRAAFFCVKKGKQEEFKSCYEHYYKDHFYCFSKEEINENNLFGYGKHAKRYDEVLGDFLLVSKDASCFLNIKGDRLISHHAGSTKEEREINLSILK